MSSHQQSQLSFPRGWYTLSFSDELAPGQELPLHCFDRPVLLYRPQDAQQGPPTLRCVTGEAMPWPISEHSGLILVYYDEQGRAPDYTVPVIEQFSSPEWSDWTWRSIVVATQGREIIENVADVAHFMPVHGAAMEQFQVVLDGPTAAQISIAGGFGERGQPIHFKTVATYHGPGCQISTMEGGVIPSVLINTHLPIDHGTIKLFFGIMIPARATVDETKKSGSMWMDEVSNGYFQDVEIWKYKKWRDKPMLCDGDGPIVAIRKWHKQFTSDSPQKTDLVWDWVPNEAQLGMIEDHRLERERVGALREAKRKAREARKEAREAGQSG